MNVGDRVIIVARDHPWHGTSGHIIGPFLGALEWTIELDNGQRAGALSSDLRVIKPPLGASA